MNTKITLRWVISVIVIVSSVIICIMGINYQKQLTNRNNLMNAESTFTNDLIELQKIQQQVNQYYIDETHEFIKPDIDLNQLETILSSVTIIKSTPENFHLKNSDFSEKSLQKSKELTTIKKTVVNSLNDLIVKSESQKAIEPLFIQPPTNWQVIENDDIINLEVTTEKIENVRQMTYKEQGTWKESMDRFLTTAKNQLNEYQSLKKSIDEQMDGDKLSTEASLDNYFSLSAKVEEIKNQQMKAELSAKLDTIYNLLTGQYGINSNVPIVQEPTLEFNEAAIVE